MKEYNQILHDTPDCLPLINVHPLQQQKYRIAVVQLETNFDILLSDCETLQHCRNKSLDENSSAS